MWLANCCFASVGQSDIALNLDTVPIRQGHSSATHQRRGIVQILISLTGRPSGPEFLVTVLLSLAE